MKKMGCRQIGELNRETLKNIKLIVFDVDGVIVPRGTKIKQKGNTLKLETKQVLKKQIEQIMALSRKGFHVDINSGRGLWMLQQMFFDVLPQVSLTYENGSATWRAGRIYQYANSFNYLRNTADKLKAVKHRNIRGFEPKEFIITIHCTNRVIEIERIVAKDKMLYAIWNDEAYDIGVKKIQTKAIGLRNVMKLLKLGKKNVLAMGDNYNDKELLGMAGIAVTADKRRVSGDFFVPLRGKELPAEILMSKILEVVK